MLAINVDARPRFDVADRLPEPRDILSLCSSLVTTTETTGVSVLEVQRTEVRLAHASVRDYLLSNQSLYDLLELERYSMFEGEAHKAVAKSCLAYLLQFDNPTVTPDTPTEFPLARYAAQYWVYHARLAQEGGGSLDQLSLELLQSNRNAFVNWIRLYDPEKPWEGPFLSRAPETIASPLLYVCLTDLVRLARRLLDSRVDINEKGGSYGTALHAICIGGRDWGRRDEHGRFIPASPYGALDNEHEELVSLLLNRGADVNLHAGALGSCLKAACMRGNLNIVKLLVERGASSDPSHGYHEIPLQAAVSQQHYKVVEYLLDRGADINYCETLYPALSIAVIRGNLQIAKLLIDRGANVNQLEPRMGQSPLMLARRGRHWGIVKLLLEKGAIDDTVAEGNANAVSASGDPTPTITDDFASIGLKAKPTEPANGTHGMD
jgi:ankyrin repeat protein